MGAEARALKSHRVALTFEDGVTRFISCAEGQHVADAAYRARINIPVDCQDGACGTCKARCESGEYDRGSYIEDALSADEARQGFCLPCVMTPKSDLVLQIASTSAVAKTRAATYTGRITALDRLSPTVVAVTTEIPNRSELAFLPGQYINVAVPGTEHSRSYSFANGPDDQRLALLVKLTPGGVMSQYLTDRAAIGDVISFTGPHGSFFLREAEDPLLLLAGGTGLAPILSILRGLKVSRTSRHAHLLYGVTTDADLVELETIDQLAGEIETLTWDYCVADPATAAPNQGYVTSLIRPEHLAGGDVAIYLCGPPAMVEAARAHLATEGVAPSGFYYEKFALAGTADAARVDGPVAGVGPVVPETSVSLSDVAAAPAAPLAPVTTSPTEAPAQPHRDDAQTARTIMGQEVGRPGSSEPVRALDSEDSMRVAPDARSISGQPLLPTNDIGPLAADVATDDVSGGGAYIIGEEHPSVDHSDAIFEARKGLELGALGLTIGRLSTAQLAGWRLLAESTLPYVDGDRFVDAAEFTETNAAFHEYLFTLTGNEHLLQAYQALGVRAHMDEVLRRATWCHPGCAGEHLEIVSAFEAADMPAARRLITRHAEHSKLTMRRAMDDTRAGARPQFVSPGRFAGNVVIVTGAAQGIGERTARRLGAEGAILVLADRSELVRGLAQELAATGPAAHAVVADLETWKGANAVVTEALARFGRVDVAVHTVGGTIWARPFEHYTPEQIQAEINRSLFPTLWCCRAVLPPMIERGSGTIVNVSSVATRGINRVPYAAAKGGVNAITTALALEAAPHGVRVVSTAPGGTEAPERRIPRGPSPETAQDRQWYQAVVEQTIESSLLKRYGSLDEQAAAITFLASSEASYITGTVLPVAGGDPG